MKELNLVIDLSVVTLGEAEAKMSPAELSMVVIKNILLSHCQENKGFGEEERRMYYKICDAFDKTLEEKATTIQLEDAWAKMILKARSKCPMIPNKLLQQVEIALDNIKD